jgi:acyl-CoA synthetase (AMP-forming)/AMP-acid ligase II
MTEIATNPLTLWTGTPATNRGIRFWRTEGWRWWSYEDLAGLARRVAGGIAASGVQHDDRVLLVERTGPAFVASLFGTMLAGAIPCPVAPPYVFQNGGLYAAHLRAIGEVARPSLVITTADLVDRFSADGTGPQVRTADELAACGECAPGPRATAALLQFTSGSSGRVNGVRVPVDALTANLAAIRNWTEMSEGDATASWLPLHHDMGLIGCLLTPVVEQRDLWLQEPVDFVRDPTCYLACFSGPGAVMTAMPPFGLDYIASRVPPEALAGFDFSGWRALIIGAERIDVDVLDRFMALVGPFGFERRALLPAYGLAEATLAVTGLPLRDELTTVPVAPRLLSLGEPVTSTDREVQHVVGCGPALDGVAVAVVDEDGRELPDHHLGQIVVSGPSIAEGYAVEEKAVEEEATSLTEWRDSRLWTGDAGFLVDGQLFVIGRIGDAMKVRGRTVFAEDIEAALVAAGLPRLRTAVLLGSSPRGSTAVVLLEQPEEDWVGTATAAVQRVAEHIASVFLDVPRRSIRRTTSGKPKRREMWAAYVAGELEGTELGGLFAAPADAARD